MEATGALEAQSALSDVYVARVDDSVSEAAFSVLSALRDAGVSADADHQGRSLKAQFKQADRRGAALVVVVGPEELAAGEVTLRDMATKAETRVPVAAISQRVQAALGA